MEASLPRKYRTPEKHIDYWALLDACSQQGCPICRLLKNTAERRIAALLYEEVNDAYVRQHLRASFGFCYSHALLLLQSSDGLGIALIYRDLIECVLDAIKKRKRRDLFPTQECPICELYKELTKNYVNVLLQHSHDQEMREELERSFGLCLPHLARVVKSTNDESLNKWFRRLATKAQQKQRILLQQFVRKHEIAHSHEPITDQEKQSCQDAIDMLVGMNV